MPKIIAGLQEVGLADWPAWFRTLNPGYFVSEPQPSTSPIQATHCVKGGCTRASYCRERSQNGGGRERKDRRDLYGGEGDGKKEVNQTLEKPRNLPKDGAGGKKSAVKSHSQSILLEMAQVKDTRDWEHESDTEVEEVISGPHVQVVIGEKKLVDI